MGQFEDALKMADKELNDVEARKRQWIPVTDVKLDDLPNQMDSAQVYCSFHDLNFKFSKPAKTGLPVRFVDQSSTET